MRVVSAWEAAVVVLITRRVPSSGFATLNCTTVIVYLVCMAIMQLCRWLRAAVRVVLTAAAVI